MLAVLFVILAVAALFGTTALARALDESRALRAAESARASVLNLRLDEESLVRRYVITGNSQFLRPSLGAERVLADTLDQLARALGAAAIADGTARVRALRDLQARWVATVVGPMRRQRRSADSRPLQLRGVPLVDAFRVSAEGLQREIDARADQNERDLAAVLRRIVFFSFVSIALAGAAIIAVSRGRNRLQRQLDRERHRQGELERGMAELRQIAESVPEVVWIANPDGLNAYVNERWVQYSGQRRDDALGDGWAGAIHPDDNALTNTRWTYSLRTGAPFECEFRIRAADGSYRWFITRATPQRADDGTILRWFGTCTDIDDRKRAFDALEAREAELRTLAETVPHMVWIARPDGFNDYFNSRWYEFTGLTFDASQGAGWSSIVHPDDYEHTMRAWQHALQTGEPYEIEQRMRSRDGTYRWFVGRALPQRDKRGEIVRWIGTSTDVHEQHEAFAATQRISNALQQALLPTSLPADRYVAFDATYAPASNVATVGGDWYDAVALGDGRFVFSIGDVAGHGLRSAVIMSRVRQAILALAIGEPDPAVVLRKANEALRLQAESMVTALCGFYDRSTHEIVYASAGHPPPVLANAQNARFLPHRGLALGITDDVTPDRFVERAEPGSLLVLYTDGILEFGRDMADAERRLLAASRLVAELHLPNPAREIKMRTLAGQSAGDDIAILTARVTR